MCPYASSDLDQAAGALASIWPSFLYLVSGTFLLKIKPHDQHLSRLGTRVVQEGPSAGLGSGAAASPWNGQTDFGCWPPHCPYSCRPHHIWIFSLWTMKVFTTRKKMACGQNGGHTPCCSAKALYYPPLRNTWMKDNKVFNKHMTLRWKELTVHWRTWLLLRIILKIGEMCWEE